MIALADSVLRNKSKEFAKQIVILCREIKQEHRESVLTHQLLRSGTSIGANIHEANYAQSRADFVSKLQIALKECFETEYWLELFIKAGLEKKEIITPLYDQCRTIRRILVASINTAKNNKE